MAKSETSKLENLLIGRSTVIRRVRNTIEKLSSNRKNVLILGERGTGKISTAQAIHKYTSPNALSKLFHPLTTEEQGMQNLSNESLQTAGTVIIRDIEDFSFVQQKWFVKLIQLRMGSKTERVIVTAREPIPKLMMNGKLIPELGELLKSFELIQLPPLIERSEDIPMFIEYFAEQTSKALEMPMKSLDINMIDALSRRIWKENIRELKTVVEHAVIASQGEFIEFPTAIQDELTQLNGILSSIKERKQFMFDKALAGLERILITRALEATNYNQTQSAHILGISGANFRYRLKKFKLKRKRDM
jgi:two-component system, NtrC family, response regulator HydG